MRDAHSLSGDPVPAWKVWLKTSRPPTLVATISPVLVGTAVAVFAGTFHPLNFVVTLLSCLFLQIGTNYFNEYFDYRYGLDHAGSLGASTVIFRREMTAGQVLGGGIGCFALAALFGIVLIFLVGPAILLFGLVGLLIAYFYSARPFKFSSRGLGDVMVYIAMGLLMVWGSYYVQIPAWSWSAFAASVPIGFIAMALLNMNNMRDYEDDLAVNKKTLPVRFGLRFGQFYHAFLIFGAYLALTIFALTGLLPLLSLLTWLTFPLAFINVYAVFRVPGRQTFIAGMKQTSRLLLLVGIVLTLSIVIAAIIL